MNCAAKTQDDQPCQSPVLAGSEFCYFHDPASGKQRREAQSKGGRNRLRLEAIPAPPCEVDLTDPGKITDMLNLVANRLVNGQMEPKVAYAVGYLANLALRLKEVRELDEQIAANRLRRAERPDGFPDDFGYEGDGIQWSELPEEEALAKLSDQEIIKQLDQLRAKE
jgi:hypothetical protein